MLVPNRHGSSDSYRYGFQGQEKDDEIKGEGNSLNYTFRMHDPRVGRFFARDPLENKYPELTPYQFSSNTPIMAVELEGLETAFEHALDKKFASSAYIHMSNAQRNEERKVQAVAGILMLTAVVDIYVTKGRLSQAVGTYFLGDFVHSAQMQTYYRDQGNEARAEKYEREGAEASKVLILGLVADGAIFTIGRVAQTVRALKNLEGAKFAQTSINRLEKFSEKGAEIYSKKSGMNIETVDDLVGALKAKKISVKDLPVDYVVKNGEKVILNTRTSVALDRAGVPMNEWYGVNRTGQKAFGSSTYDDLAADQIKKNYKPGEALSSEPPR